MKPTQTPPPPQCSISSLPLQGPLFSQRCALPPLRPASHTLCVCSSSGTPREGPAAGTGGSGGPGGSLGSRGRRRKLYSAVPGRSFMAVKSYQAQAEGEISLSKGEKIKGKGAAGPTAGQEGQGAGPWGGAVRTTGLEASENPEMRPSGGHSPEVPQLHSLKSLLHLVGSPRSSCPPPPPPRLASARSRLRSRWYSFPGL